MSEPAAPRRWSPLALVTWLGGAFVGTICGVGGGIFATPILHYFVGLPFQTAIGTSLVLVFVMTTVATGMEATRLDGAIDWQVVLLLLIGSIPGAQLGYRVSKRVDTRTLKLCFILVLLAAAARTWTLQAKSAGDPTSGVRLDVVHGAWVIVLGLGGGFLAPMLGIGGGILVIPALFLTLPDTSYLEARACSMAMSIVNAAQSVVLHFRGGTVDAKSAVPFTVIAVIGAVAGVWAVHLPGWSEVARIAMTAVLVFVAARLAWDVWSARAALEK